MRWWFVEKEKITMFVGNGLDSQFVIQAKVEKDNVIIGLSNKRHWYSSLEKKVEMYTSLICDLKVFLAWHEGLGDRNRDFILLLNYGIFFIGRVMENNWMRLPSSLVFGVGWKNGNKEMSCWCEQMKNECLIQK